MSENLQYCIAYCGHNCLGLITSSSQEWNTYPDGNTKRTWKGIHLTNKKYAAGSPWTSKYPRIVGRMEPAAARELMQSIRKY